MYSKGTGASSIAVLDNGFVLWMLFAPREDVVLVKDEDVFTAIFKGSGPWSSG